MGYLAKYHQDQKEMAVDVNVGHSNVLADAI